MMKQKGGPSSRPRGKPPKEVWNHAVLVARIKERLKHNPSVLNACRIVQQKYYPDRSVDGIRKTYTEVTTSKLFARPGAMPNSSGYISAHDWELTSKARERFLDLMRDLAWAVSLVEQEKAGLPIGDGDRDWLEVGHLLLGEAQAN